MLSRIASASARKGLVSMVRSRAMSTTDQQAEWHALKDVKPASYFWTQETSQKLKISVGLGAGLCVADISGRYVGKYMGWTNEVADDAINPLISLNTMICAPIANVFGQSCAILGVSWHLIGSVVLKPVERKIPEPVEIITSVGSTATAFFLATLAVKRMPAAKLLSGGITLFISTIFAAFPAGYAERVANGESPKWDDEDNIYQPITTAVVDALLDTSFLMLFAHTVLRASIIPAPFWPLAAPVCYANYVIEDLVCSVSKVSEKPKRVFKNADDITIPKTKGSLKPLEASADPAPKGEDIKIK